MFWHAPMVSGHTCSVIPFKYMPWLLFISPCKSVLESSIYENVHEFPWSVHLWKYFPRTGLDTTSLATLTTTIIFNMSGSFSYAFSGILLAYCWHTANNTYYMYLLLEASVYARKYDNNDQNIHVQRVVEHMLTTYFTPGHSFTSSHEKGVVYTFANHLILNTKTLP